MENLNVTSIPGISAEIQTLINLFFLALVGAGGAYQYFRRKPSSAPISQDVQVIGGAFADRRYIERLCEAIENATAHMERLGDERRRDAEIIERAIKNVGDDMQRAIDTARRRRAD